MSRKYSENKVLGSIDKYKRIMVQVSLNHWETPSGDTQDFIDIREYYKNRKGDIGPTSKGVTIPPELFGDFVLVVVRAAKTLGIEIDWEKVDGISKPPEGV